jgi:1-pyrroline-5-carboxylate dehydrogenase
VSTGKTASAVMPHDHRHVLGDYHMAGPAEVDAAIKSAVAAQREWASWPWEDRAAVFLKAGELLATTWRATLNAATMLNQSKTAYQAEIDSACELTDFFRFNPYYAQQLYREQPISDKGMWNQADYRGLEGFVYAVTPSTSRPLAGTCRARRR